MQLLGALDAIRVLIVHTEEAARLRLRGLLEAEANVEVVAEASGSVDAVRCIRDHRPHLVFLHFPIQEHETSGVLQQLADTRFPLFVFVSPYDAHAVKAFETAALDYLLEPFSDERFAQTLTRARTRLREQKLSEYSERLLSVLQEYHDRSDETSAPLTPYGDRLVLKTGSRLVFIDADDVDWIESEGAYVRLHIGQKSHLLRESLQNVEDRLDPNHFLRIHRSTIVNVDRIKEIVPHYNGGAIVVLRDGQKLKLSRGYQSRVNATLG